MNFVRSTSHVFRAVVVAAVPSLLCVAAFAQEPLTAEPPAPSGDVVKIAPEAVKIAPEAKVDPIAEADALMKKRGLKNLRKAVKIYEKALSAKPNDVDLLLKTADALNGVIRRRTQGNSVLIDGTSDNATNKKIFATLGAKSLKYAEKAIKSRPNNVRAHAIYTDSFIYASTSYGLIRAALGGAATTYKDNAKKMTKLDKKYDGGLGHMLMAAFYTAAPWPLVDTSKAVTIMRKAMRIKSASRRNQYYMAVVLYRDGQYKKSIPFFKAVPKTPCASPTERDFCQFLKKEAARALPIAIKEAG